MYHLKEECLSFIQKQTYANRMQIMLVNINEIQGKIEYIIIPIRVN